MKTPDFMKMSTLSNDPDVMKSLENQTIHVGVINKDLIGKEEKIDQQRYMLKVIQGRIARYKSLNLSDTSLVKDLTSLEQIISEVIDLKEMRKPHLKFSKEIKLVDPELVEGDEWKKGIQKFKKKKEEVVITAKSPIDQDVVESINDRMKELAQEYREALSIVEAQHHEEYLIIEHDVNNPPENRTN